MPRLTRAQLRAQEAEGGPQNIHEDTDEKSKNASHEYDPFSTEVSARPPLGEIVNSNAPFPELEGIELEPAEKIKGSKHVKANRPENIDLVLANNENSLQNSHQEILDDECQSDASSAAEAAAVELRRAAPVPDNFQVTVDAARSGTPASMAAKEASKSLSRSPQRKLIAVHGSALHTPKFDPIVHAETPSASQARERVTEDSFVGTIITRTPARMMTTQEPTGDGPDSFLEDIISRSPSKYVARIEDSVEAIDALDEAIEQVADELPKAMNNSLESPSKPTTTPRAAAAKPSPKQSISASAASSKQATKRPINGTRLASTTKASAPTKAAQRKPNPRISSVRPQTRSSTLANAKPRSSTQPTPSAQMPPKTTDPSPPTTTKPRKPTPNLSTSKPGFRPTKSSKPPTKSTFTLPGDAFAAKIKAAREERLKKEEEAEAEAARKRVELKARPVPRGVSGSTSGAANGDGKEIRKGRVSSVLPRETAASRARLSFMLARKEKEGGEEGSADAKKGIKKVGNGLGSVRVSSGVRKSVMPSTSTTPSALSVTKTRKLPPVANAGATVGRVSKSTVPANTSAVRRVTAAAATPARPAPSKPRQSTFQPTRATLATRTSSDRSSGVTKPIAAVTTTATRTSKGKEVFRRAQLAEEDLQKQKREKEGAAKKARAEAAERGRLASREWAEKQKKLKRKTAVVEAKMEGEGDVRMAERDGGGIVGVIEDVEDQMWEERGRTLVRG